MNKCNNSQRLSQSPAHLWKVLRKLSKASVPQISPLNTFVCVVWEALTFQRTPRFVEITMGGTGLPASHFTGEEIQARMGSGSFQPT